MKHSLKLATGLSVACLFGFNLAASADPDFKPGFKPPVGRPPITVGIVVQPPRPVGIVVRPPPVVVGIKPLPRPPVIGILPQPPIKPPVKPPVVGILPQPRPPVIGIVAPPRPPKPPIIVGLPVPPRPRPPVIGIVVPRPPRPRPPIVLVPCPRPVFPVPVIVGGPVVPVSPVSPVPVPVPTQPEPPVQPEMESYSLSCVQTSDKAKELYSVTTTVTPSQADRFVMAGVVVGLDAKQETFSAEASGEFGEKIDLKLRDVGDIQLELAKDEKGSQFYHGKVTLLGKSDAYGLHCGIEKLGSKSDSEESSQD